jgi:hypothetical protein
MAPTRTSAPSGSPAVARAGDIDREVTMSPDCRRFRWAAPAVTPAQAAAGVGYGEGFAANSHRFAPGGMLAGRSNTSSRSCTPSQRVRPRRQYGAAPRRRARRRRDDSVSCLQGADVRRSPAKADDGGHGQWPGPSASSRGPTRSPLSRSSGRRTTTSAFLVSLRIQGIQDLRIFGSCATDRPVGRRSCLDLSDRKPCRP